MIQAVNEDEESRKLHKLDLVLFVFLVLAGVLRAKNEGCLLFLCCLFEDKRIEISFFSLVWTGLD